MNSKVSKVKVVESGAESRRHIRQDIEIILMYTTMGQFKSDIATNISLGGLFIKSTNPIKVGSKVRVSFSVPNFMTRFEANGIIMHQGTPSCPGMGIKFSEVHNRALAILDELIKREQAQIQSSNIKKKSASKKSKK